MSMRNPFREDVDGQSRKISTTYLHGVVMSLGTQSISIRVLEVPWVECKFFKFLRYPMMQCGKNSGGPCSCCVQLIPWVYLVKTTT